MMKAPDDDLNELLRDVCEFLSGEIFLQNPLLRPKASGLIARAKLQILKTQNCNEHNSYVDMQGNKSSINDYGDENDTYASLMECDLDANQKQCPLTELPTKNIPPHVKSGHLVWRTKFIFNFEKNRQIYAAIYETFFLIYNTEKDDRPVEIFDLREYRAKPIEKYRDGKAFNLFLNPMKQMTFIALSPDDMLQWVTAIRDSCAENLDVDLSIPVAGPNLPPRSMNQLNCKYSDKPIYETVSINSDMDDGVEYCTIQSPNDLVNFQPIYDAVQTPVGNIDYQNFTQKHEGPLEAKKSVKPHFLKMKCKYRVKAQQDCFKI